VPVGVAVDAHHPVLGLPVLVGTEHDGHGLLLRLAISVSWKLFPVIRKP
jgi:hypothetical protein